MLIAVDVGTLSTLIETRSCGVAESVSRLEAR
jgi:hypothetical protein